MSNKLSRREITGYFGQWQLAVSQRGLLNKPTTQIRLLKDGQQTSAISLHFHSNDELKRFLEKLLAFPAEIVLVDPGAFADLHGVL